MSDLRKLAGFYDDKEPDTFNQTIDTISDDMVSKYTWIFDHLNTSFIALDCNCNNEQQFLQTLAKHCPKDIIPFYSNEMKFITKEEMLQKKGHDWRGLFVHHMKIEDLAKQIIRFFKNTNVLYGATNKKKGR